MRASASPVLVLVTAAAAATIACTSPEEQGRLLYAQHGCAACHGATGRGDGPSARRLDVPPRDFADINAYRLGSSQSDIAVSIRAGGGAMPPFRDLSESEARDIAAWIVSLARNPDTATADVAIKDAWVRASTATRTSTSGYLTIENRTSKAVTLIRVSLEGAGGAHVHTMVDRQGQAVMQPVDKVQVPAHGSVDLAPGGMHLMLTDITRPLNAGTTVQMALTFDDGRTRTVHAVVRPLSATSAR